MTTPNECPTCGSDQHFDRECPACGSTCSHCLRAQLAAATQRAERLEADLAALRAAVAATDKAVDAVVVIAFGPDPRQREREIVGRVLHAVREVVASQRASEMGERR